MRTKRTTSGGIIGAVASTITCGGSSKSPSSVAVESNGEPSSTKGAAVTASSVAIDAVLDVVDTGYGPSLRVTSKKYEFVDVDDDGSVSLSAGIQGNRTVLPIMSKIIPFSKINDVSPGDADLWKSLGIRDAHQSGVVVLTAAALKGVGDNVDAAESGRKLLVFDVPYLASNVITREEVIRHLDTLIEWDRGLRRAEAEKAKCRQEGKVKKEGGGKEDDKHFTLMEDCDVDDATDESSTQSFESGKDTEIGHPQQGGKIENEVSGKEDGEHFTLMDDGDKGDATDECSNQPSESGRNTATGKPQLSQAVVA